MPHYDFRCDSGHDFSAIVSIAKRNDPIPCRSCGVASHRIFSLSVVPTHSHEFDRWHDVAPIDPDRGVPYESPKEAFKSGNFEPLNTASQERARRDRKAALDTSLAEAKKAATRRAWRKHQDNERVIAARKDGKITVRSTDQ